MASLDYGDEKQTMWIGLGMETEWKEIGHVYNLNGGVSSTSQLRFDPTYMTIKACIYNSREEMPVNTSLFACTDAIDGPPGWLKLCPIQPSRNYVPLDITFKLKPRFDKAHFGLAIYGFNRDGVIFEKSPQQGTFECCIEFRNYP